MKALQLLLAAALTALFLQPSAASLAQSPAVGVTFAVERADKPGAIARTITDAEGNGVIANLPAGSYVLVPMLQTGRQEPAHPFQIVSADATASAPVTLSWPGLQADVVIEGRNLRIAARKG